MGPVRERRTGSGGGNRPDRRSSIRFSLELVIRYIGIGTGSTIESGVGRTVNLSSSGVCFLAEKELPAGQQLHVFIDWPAALHGAVQLQLVAWGGIVRSEGLTTTMQIERYEFRTRRRGKNEVPGEAQ